MKKFLVLFLTAFLMMNQTSFSQDKTSAPVVKFIIHTDLGDMEGYLYNETPQHRDNFEKLANDGYFDGLLFHRVIPGFMIQGGDPVSKNAKPGQQLGAGGPNYTIPAEFNPALFHKKGAMAAARQGDQVNPKKASSGSQFYIVEGKKYTAAQLGSQYTEAQKKIYETVGGVPFLDTQYTVFGEITTGLDVIDKIANVPKDANDRPLKDIKMTIKIIK